LRKSLPAAVLAMARLCVVAKPGILARRADDENLPEVTSTYEGTFGRIDRGLCRVQKVKRESLGFPVRRLHLPLLLVSQTSLREFAVWQTLSNSSQFLFYFYCLLLLSLFLR
jgi:hypothetical protein